MSNQKLQVSRAANVIPSDDVNIPFPNPAIAGANSSVSAFKLIDATVDFFALGVKPGDTVLNVSTGKYCLVEKIDNANRLSVSLDIFVATPNSYAIYQGVNEGCVLYVGGAGDIVVTTAGGDTVTFFQVNAGQFLPVQAVRVGTDTTATKILALW